MLREMQLESPQRTSAKSNRLNSASHGDNKKNFDKTNYSSESTFYKTNRINCSEKEDVILENLKYFVNNSPSINKFALPNQTSVSFFSKDYLAKNGNILHSIHNEDSFKNLQKKKMKQNSRSISGTSFYNYDKSKFLTDNVREFEDVVTELKFSVFDRIAREIHDKTNIRGELENNTSILANRLNIAKERLFSCKTSNTSTIKNTTKVEYYQERVQSENKHMNMEIPMTRKRIEEMKSEMFEKDRESRQIKYLTFREESDVTFLQEETRRIGKQVIDLQNDKKNLRTAIVLLKKQTDLFKEKIIKEDSKSKEFISELSVLLGRGKVSY